MTRLNALLLLALLASALWLVHTAYEGRRLVAALDRAQKEHRALESEFKRLDAERQTEATHQKVARVAAARLKMASPPLTLYVDAPADNAATRKQAAR
jgi:cell division protein FtsL